MLYLLSFLLCKLKFLESFYYILAFYLSIKSYINYSYDFFVYGDVHYFFYALLPMYSKKLSKETFSFF